MNGWEQAVLEEGLPLSCPPSGNWGGLAKPHRQASLPGEGEKGPKCGEWVPLLYCPTAHAGKFYVRAAEKACERRDCPDCAGRCPGGKACPAGMVGPHGGGRWAHQTAKDATKRLTQFGRGPIRQVIVSAPVERWSESDDHGVIIAKVRSRAVALCRRLAWGSDWWGTVIIHLWRGCEKDGYGKWGPHAHVLCGGVRVGETEAVEKRSGWVVKQVNRNGGRFAAYSGAVLERHLVYELGHSAVLQGGHAITWVGALKGFEMQKDEQVSECPVCSSTLEAWPWQWVITRDGVIRFPDGGSAEAVFIGEEEEK